MWLAHLPGLVSEPELERLQGRLHGRRRRMLRELAEALEVLTADRALVLVLEDLQWSDHATVEALAYLAQRPEPARLLVLGTYRPVEVLLQGHPLRGMVQELCGRGQGVDLRLEFLSAADVAAYVAGRLGGPVAPPRGVRLSRTDGNALFMVNIVEHLVQQGMVVRRAGQWTLREGPAAPVGSLPGGCGVAAAAHRGPPAGGPAGAGGRQCGGRGVCGGGGGGRSPGPRGGRRSAV